MITQKGKCRQKRMLTKVCVHGRFSFVTQGKRGVSSVGELLPYKQAVVGSNPSPPKYHMTERVSPHSLVLFSALPHATISVDRNPPLSHYWGSTEKGVFVCQTLR